MKKIKVFISSPYTIGDVAVNVRKSIDAFIKLKENSFIPFSPIAMSHFIQMVKEIEYDSWLEWDFEWVKTCDCVLRLPGISNGADKEVEEAKKNNIPIFYSIEKLIEYYDGK
jgi:hypothetical protein